MLQDAFEISPGPEKGSYNNTIHMSCVSPCICIYINIYTSMLGETENKLINIREKCHFSSEITCIVKLVYCNLYLVKNNLQTLSIRAFLLSAADVLFSQKELFAFSSFSFWSSWLAWLDCTIWADGGFLFFRLLYRYSSNTTCGQTMMMMNMLDIKRLKNQH